MRICIDTRALLGRMWFGGGNRTGVGRYVYELIDGLSRADTHNEYVLFFNSFKAPATEPISKILERPNVTLNTYRLPNKIFDRSARFLRWPKIDKLIKGGVDLYLNPHINIAPLSPGQRYIQVVHDLTFEVYPEFFAWRKRFWNWAQDAKQACLLANRIVALSQSTKADLTGLYGVDENKISVVYPGVDDAQALESSINSTTLSETYKIGTGYILYLGTLQPRKNIESLVQAYSRLATRMSELPDLVLAGTRGWSWRSIMQEIERSQVRSKIKLLDYVPEEHLPALYSRAALLVWPSYYEGFGFPTLEAMAAGVPVVASHTSSLPEILQAAAVYANPHDVNDLTQAMYEVLTNNSLQQDLVEKGYKQAKKFPWHKTIERMLQIINSVN